MYSRRSETKNEHVKIVNSRAQYPNQTNAENPTKKSQTTKACNKVSCSRHMTPHNRELWNMHTCQPLLPTNILTNQLLVVLLTVLSMSHPQWSNNHSGTEKNINKISCGLRIYEDSVAAWAVSWLQKYGLVDCLSEIRKSFFPCCQVFSSTPSTGSLVFANWLLEQTVHDVGHNLT